MESIIKPKIDSEPPKSLHKKEGGSTTLEQCGWCKFASGSHRHNYCIEGKCILKKSYSDKIQWDTKCSFKNASKADLEAIIESHKYTISENKGAIQRHKEYILEIKRMMPLAAIRPPLPSDRKAEHFNIDDPIAVFYDKENKWFFGQVKNGYRHQDGFVSFRLDELGPQTANDKTFPFKDGYSGMGMSVPHVMLKKEYDFFERHPRDYQVWCKKGYMNNYNGKQIQLAEIKPK